LLGNAYFQSRHQFIRVIASCRHDNQKDIKKIKEELGVKLDFLKRFVADEENIYSVEKQFEWDS